MLAFLFLLKASFTLALVQANNLPSTNFIGHQQLDPHGKYLLSWELVPSTQKIFFQVTVETLGYVGFGLSPTGGMRGSDIFIAGVFPNGTTYNGDHFAESSNQMPILDVQQDWTASSSEENGTHTQIRFHRRLHTCDENDIPITDSTIRVIWSMGTTDEISYHGGLRGSKSVNFYLKDPTSFDRSQFQQMNISINISMPSNDTTYWCTIHQLPELTSKHHIVAFEPLLENLDAQQHTHHFILYRCQIPDTFTLSGWLYPRGDHCHIGSMSYTTYPFSQYCMPYPIYGWSKGGLPTIFPSEVGLPFPEIPGTTEYWALETHLDNPQNLADKTIETGLRFFFTPNLRTHDVGLLVVEHHTEPEILIPPQSPAFLIPGHCSAACTQNLLPEEGITVFSVMLHAHLHARSLKLRHFRESQELEPLSREPHYDFNWQQNKPLNKVRKILPGDQMTVECTYETGEKAVMGGLSAREEMCQAWLFYWPRINASVCGSLWKQETHLRGLGLVASRIKNTGYEGGLGTFFIREPDMYAGDYEEVMSHKYNWTVEKRIEYQQQKKMGGQLELCGRWDVESINWSQEERITYPEGLKEWEGEKGGNCGREGQTEQRAEEMMGIIGDVVAQSIGTGF